MGILDDAIREHLDLKRRRGAEEGEIARLEDEAFGPPSRPGDPDFPEEEQAAAEAGPPPTGEVATAEPTTGEAAIAEPTTGEQQAMEPESEVSAPPATEEAEALDAPEPTPEPAAPEAEVAAPEAEFATPAREPTPEPEPEAAAPEPEAAAPEPEVAAPEPEAAAPEPEAPPAEPATPAREQPAEPPIESLDTVEHPFEGAITETGEAEAVEGEIVEDEDEDEAGEDDEDVLEETPEFLRDQPEDDELWFEQGEPKDFDF